MAQQLGIFGYPLVHSISPAFQQAALEFCSIPATYSAWPTPPDKLAKEVDKLRSDQYMGANVTIPHKEQASYLLDENDSWAEEIGAVNTIVKEGVRLIGHNTDAYGFVRSLREIGGVEPRGASVLLLGAGGAARAVAFGLARERVADLTIANRTLKKARSLADEIRVRIGAVSAIPLEESALAQALSGVDLVVNSTSLGMRHSPSEGLTPLRSDLIPSGVLVHDLVYGPSETPLLAEARKAGARTLGGLSMLIFQGARSFEMWTGKEAPIDVMFRAGEEALAT